MMQNMMNMMMANPAMQEMMASQMQDMMANSFALGGQTGVVPTQPTNFAKVSDKPPLVVGAVEPRATKPPVSSGGMPVQGFSRDEPHERPEPRQSTSTRPVEPISKKIDEMFQDDVEDLDDFYHRYSRSPRATKIPEGPVQVKPSYTLNSREQAYLAKPEPDYLHAKTMGYGQQYHEPRGSRPERYDSYRPSSAMNEDHELLGANKPSVLLQVESEMVPFRDSHEFGNNDSARKDPLYQDSPGDFASHDLGRHRGMTSDFDRGYHERSGEKKGRDGGYNNYGEDSAEKYSRIRGTHREEDQYQTEPVESARGQGRNIRRHNNYFTDIDPGQSLTSHAQSHVAGDDRPIKRRFEADRGLSNEPDTTPDRYISKQSDHGGHRDTEPSPGSITEDAHVTKVKANVNPYDDIPVVGGKKNNFGPSPGTSASITLDYNQRQTPAYEDLPIRGASRNQFESPAEALLGSAEGPRDKPNSRGYSSNRGTPSVDYAGKHATDMDGEDDDFGRTAPFSNQPMNEHESKQIKATGKDFMQLLEEKLALEGGSSAGGIATAPPPAPRKHSFLKKNSRQVAPKPAVKRKPNDAKNSRDASSTRQREDSRHAEDSRQPSVQHDAEDDHDKDYQLDHYLRDDKSDNFRSSHNEAKTAVVYDDREPWDDPKPSKPTDNEAKQESAQKSSLLAAYFGDKNKNEAKEQKIVAKEEEAIAKKYVSDKVDDLDREIKRLKADRETVKAKERKVEDERKRLAKEKEEFEAFVKAEKAKLEEFKEEELKKMKKEKKIAERNQKAVMNMPNRKEREEIDSLKDKLAKSSEEFAAKEKKAKLTIERQKKQIEELLKRNKELEEEVYLLEQARLKGANEEKSKPNPKASAKKSVVEESFAPQNAKRRTDDVGRESSKAPIKLKTKGSKLVEEKEDLLDFQKAEDEADNEIHDDMNAYESSEDEEDTYGQNAKPVDVNDNKFQMNINPNEYAYSANKYYQEYIQAKNKSSF